MRICHCNYSDCHVIVHTSVIGLGLGRLFSQISDISHLDRILTWMLYISPPCIDILLYGYSKVQAWVILGIIDVAVNMWPVMKRVPVCDTHRNAAIQTRTPCIVYFGASAPFFEQPYKNGLFQHLNSSFIIMSALSLLLVGVISWLGYKLWRAVTSPVLLLRGPPNSDSWIRGNLKDIRAADPGVLHEKWRREYGDVFVYRANFWVSGPFVYEWTRLIDWDDLLDWVEHTSGCFW